MAGFLQKKKNPGLSCFSFVFRGCTPISRKAENLLFSSLELCFSLLFRTTYLDICRFFTLNIYNVIPLNCIEECY